MKRILAAMVCAAFAAACLTACARSVSEPEALSQEETRIEDLDSEEGVVLDATDKTLILRTPSGLEYIFSLLGTEVEGGEALTAGQRVTVFYETEDGSPLTAANSKRARVPLVRVSAAEKITAQDKGSTADGFVVQTGSDYTVIETRAGSRYTFATANTVQSLPDGLYEGLWVRVTFDGVAKPGEVSNALVRSVSECASEPDTYMLSGTISAVDGTENTLTLTASDGVRYTFDVRHAEYARGQQYTRGVRAVVYYRGQAENARSGKRGGYPQALRVDDARVVPVQHLDAVVSDSGEENGTLTVHAMDGRRLSFRLRGVQVSGAALRQGDLARITYQGALTGTETSGVTVKRVERLMESSETEFSVSGVIIAMTEKSVALRTEEGREISFAQMADAHAALPPQLAPGDALRVYFTGWLGGEDDPDDTSSARVTRAAVFYP